MVKKKILVVDDEIEFLEMMRMRLEANDYDVVTARDGKEAIDKVRKEKPDAVLLDVLMPGMDGLDVLKKIRKISRDLPIFIITAFSSQERIKLADKFKASGFIIKTDDLQTEVDTITAALDLASGYKR